MHTDPPPAGSSADQGASSMARTAALTRAATALPTWTLTSVQRDDVDLLHTGGYAPLTGFLTRTEVAAVRARRRLPDGTPWPTPIMLTVPAATAEAASTAGQLALRDDDGTLLAVLEVTDAWKVGDRWSLAGRVEGVRTSGRWDFADLRASVADVRTEVAEHPVLVAQPVAGVDERTAARWTRAAEQLGTRLVVMPGVGADPERRHVARVRAYRALLGHLPADTRLWLLPSGRDPGHASAAALHAVIARNAGASHLVLGDTDLAADLVVALGLEPVDPAAFAAAGDPPAGRLHADVGTELGRGDPPRSQRGFVVLLSGLSGSGKSTVAKVLRARLSEAGDRQVTLLDGDLVRRHLSSELGFSREHRDLNVRRIGYVASEIAKHGGIAICAPIAPYDRTRREVRDMASTAGDGFVLVHVATPLEVCERRDVKGLYAKARAGELTGFTGIDDPYEEPTDAEVTVDTTSLSPEQAAEAVIARLVADGWYAPG